jgi:signal peptidase
VRTVDTTSSGDSLDLASADDADAADATVQTPAVPARGRRRAAETSKLKGTPTSKFVAAAGRIAFTVILVLAALVFLFLAVGPRFLSYQTATMLTGSMSPGINPGDVVVSVKTPVSELKVGDVITYSIPIDDRRVETHRVLSIERDNAGRTSVTTKGDANPGPDPWTAVLSEDYVYTKAGVLPFLGDLIRALRQPIVQSVLLYGGSALLVGLVLASIWGKSNEPAPATSAPDETPGADPDQSRL